MKIDKIIDTNKLSLEEYLTAIHIAGAEQKYYPFYRFPSDKHLNEYIATIHKRDEKQIKDLLRHFLPKNVTYGSDIRAKATLISSKKIAGNDGFESTEYFRRLMAKSALKDHVWEGLSWILELLPDSPYEAVRVIDSYFTANIAFMPDDMLYGLTDCTTIIRARYLDKEHPREIFLSLFPRDFEKLIEQLYSKMGFETELTKVGRDGGIDIYASKIETGKKEKLIIQCKRYTPKITLDEVKVLHSTTLSNKATKGVYITSSEFTRDAKKFAKENPSIELINNLELTRLLNKHFGSNWANKVGLIINPR